MAEDMKAQVTVSIEDKLSQPLKDMVKVVELMDKSVRAMGDQFGSLADTLLNAAGEFTALLTPIQDAEDSVSALGDTMHGLRIHIKDVEDRLKASENAYSKAERRIDKLEAQIAELSAAMQNLTESHEQANNRIQELTEQMEDMREEQERVAEAAREAEEAERSFQARLEAVGQAGEGMMKLGAALAAPAAGMTALATKAVRTYAEVENGEVRLKNTFEAGSNSSEEMKKAVSLAEELGVSLPGSTNDMLNMFSALREQGVVMYDVLHGTGQAAANFATVMGVGFEQSAVMMSKFSEALDIPANQATELVNILQRLKGASGLTVDDLYGTFSYLGSTLKTLKIGGRDAAKEISALLTIMGSAGIEGSRAGTGLAGAMSAMANVKDKISSKGFQEKFGQEFASKGIELSFFDKSGQFIGTKKMFMELQKLKKLDDQKQLQVLTELFGEASARPMAALVAAGEKGYNEAVKKMEMQKDTRTKIKEIMGTISMSWESLQGTIETLWATLGKHINQAFGKDGIAGVINKVNEFISENIIGWINTHPKEVQEILKSFAEIPKMLEPLWKKLKEAGKWLAENNDKVADFMKLAAKLVGAGAVLGNILIGIGGSLTSIVGLVTGAQSLWGLLGNLGILESVGTAFAGIKTAAVAFFSMDAGIAAPLIAIVLSLFTLLRDLWGYCKGLWVSIKAAWESDGAAAFAEVKDAWMELLGPIGDGLKTVGGMLADAFHAFNKYTDVAGEFEKQGASMSKGIGRLMKAVAWTIKLGPTVLKAVADFIGGIGAALGTFWGLAVDNFGNIRGTASKFFSDIWNSIKNFCVNAAASIWGFFKDTFPAAAAWIENTGKKIGDLWEMAVLWIDRKRADIKMLMILLKSLIKSHLREMGENIKGAFANLAASLSEAGGKILQSLIDGMKSKTEKLKQFISSVAKTIRDFFPFSPAKRGPLRDLHKIRLIETIAETVRPAPLEKALQRTLDVSLGKRFAAPAAGGRTAAAPPSVSAGQPITVNYAPQISFSGSAPQHDLMKTLREHADELAALIRAAQNDRGRLAFS